MSKETLYCTVGCKLPHGLHLDLKVNGEPVRYTLNGANAARIVGGHGITDNIPTEFMEQWLKKNVRHPAVVNGYIFMHGDNKSAEAMARERRDVETGLGPIDPVKSGMLKGPTGETDAAALADYNQKRAANPDRNRQIQE